MGERCNFCRLPFSGAGLLCYAQSICSERRAFEDGQSNGYDVGYAQGGADERAAIVAWLRASNKSRDYDLSAAIERDEHLPKGKP